MKRIVKKAAIGVMAAVMVLLIGTTSVLAAGRGYGRNYIDINSDGVCDNAGTACRHTDSDGDGICDYCGAGHSAAHHGYSTGRHGHGTWNNEGCHGRHR